MNDDQARADIAVIRAALEQGRAYASTRGSDMMVWGCLIAAGYLGTWASATGHLPLRPVLLWVGILAIGWLVQAIRRLPRRQAPASRRPMVVALRMLWFGVGICLTLTGLGGAFHGHMGVGWFDPFGAAAMGAGFFASAALCDLPWLRWVAAAWWVGELGTFWLAGSMLSLPFSAALYVLLLAGPGLLLRLRRQTA